MHADETAKLWHAQRKQILNAALLEHILPALEHEAAAELRTKYAIFSMCVCINVHSCVCESYVEVRCGHGCA